MLLIRCLQRSRETIKHSRGFFTKNAVVEAESNPFLKYANPYPVPIAYDNVVGTIPEVKVTTLTNGLRVASQNFPFSETASIGIWINTGSRFETDETNGIGKILERMVFRGTKNRSYKDLILEVEGMGAQVRSFTDREQSGFHISVLKKDVSKAVSLLSDILVNPSLDESALMEEKEAVLKDYSELNKEMKDIVFDHLHATAFQYSPLGKPIGGPAANIRRFTKDDLRSYMARHFKGPRMVLSVAGAVDHAELVSTANKALTDVPDETEDYGVKALVTKDPYKYTGSMVHDRFPFEKECHFALAYKAASWTDPDSVTLMVMKEMLGNVDISVNPIGQHKTSTLVQRMAISGGVDSITGFNKQYHDVGLFGVYVVTDRDRCENVSIAVGQEITKMCYDISDIELQVAKNQLKAALVTRYGDTLASAEAAAQDLLRYNRLISLPEWFARIDAVNESAIRAVADRFLFDTDIAIAAAGDTQFLPDYNWFRRRTFWVRY